MTTTRVKPEPHAIRWTGHTDRGRIRKTNEDAFLALAFDAYEVRLLGKVGDARLDGWDFVFAVSDGMGGARGGQFASRVAVDAITRLLPAAYRMAATGLEAGPIEVLDELFTRIHRTMSYYSASYEECEGMGATLTLAWVTPRWLHFAHIGDSRLYYLPGSGGPLRQLTDDHSHVGWLRRMGKISEYEARAHPGKSALQRALGGGHQFVEPQAGSVGLEPGDCFLLCSDGVVDGLFDSTIERFLRENPSGETAAPEAVRLVAQAVQSGSRDNATALIVRVD